MKSQSYATLLFVSLVSLVTVGCTQGPPTAERVPQAGGTPREAPGATAETSAAIRVRITIQSKLLGKVGPQAALYVTARPVGSAGGPPLAVKRFAHPILFPLEFTLTDQDAMMPGSRLTGRLAINARISLRGPATPVAPGDPYGKAEVEAGSSVQVEINQVN